jgi:hypothetical protein
VYLRRGPRLDENDPRKLVYDEEVDEQVVRVGRRLEELSRSILNRVAAKQPFADVCGSSRLQYLFPEALLPAPERSSEERLG